MGGGQEFEQAQAAVMADIEAAATELRAALDAERAALEQGDPLALDAATSRKSTLLQRLESLDIERRQLDEASAHPPRRDSESVAQLLETCQRINAVNGGIVARQLHDVRRALDVLRGTGEGAPLLYGPGGEAHAGNMPRSLSQA